MAGLLGASDVTRRRAAAASINTTTGAIVPGSTTDATISVSWQPKVPADLLQMLDLGERVRYARFGLTRDDVRTADVDAGTAADLIVEGGDEYKIVHVDQHDWSPMSHAEFVALRVTR